MISEKYELLLASERSEQRFKNFASLLKSCLLFPKCILQFNSLLSYNVPPNILPHSEEQTILIQNIVLTIVASAHDHFKV